eukprot:CAMPEP_0201486816 /NCGR_PEP_ID=MMETSP0151_2-20130828/10866_1 /ASSEMBLY_ACC=CAM_ASM_000257 /TAXON_ID=200890 /ORGANISM="Paramoeba atlantica, Strain 621/1 / CCAP 1560/9" /LENGTH=104 /DNA_ID=CAMNT_0047871657 /DNA_START=69 /DNA_END=380 /DNA_ORIENTATION=+
MYNNREIHDAAAQGNVKQLRECLSRGDDVNLRGVQEWRPLHYAVYEGHPEAVEVLLEAGADIEARMRYSRATALHLVAIGESSDDLRFEVARILLSRNPNIEAE